MHWQAELLQLGCVTDNIDHRCVDASATGDSTGRRRMLAHTPVGNCPGTSVVAGQSLSGRMTAAGTTRRRARLWQRAQHGKAIATAAACVCAALAVHEPGATHRTDFSAQAGCHQGSLNVVAYLGLFAYAFAVVPVLHTLSSSALELLLQLHLLPLLVQFAQVLQLFARVNLPLPFTLAHALRLILHHVRARARERDTQRWPALKLLASSS